MNWEEKNSKLTRTLKFKNFLQAISFMKYSSQAIEELNHHPEWTNIYNKIEINLCTHDAGNTITAKDYELAELIDQLYLKFTNYDENI